MNGDQDKAPDTVRSSDDQAARNLSDPDPQRAADHARVANQGEPSDQDGDQASDQDAPESESEHEPSGRYADSGVWIPLDERRPMRSDANEDGKVSLGQNRQDPELVPWDSFDEYPSLEGYFWANPAHAKAQGDVPDDDDDDAPVGDGKETETATFD